MLKILRTSGFSQIIFILAIFALIAIGGGVYYLSNNKTDTKLTLINNTNPDNSILEVPISNKNTNESRNTSSRYICDTNIQAKIDPTKTITPTKFTNLSQDSERVGSIIARVVSIEPFIVEILDADLVSSYNTSLGIREDLFVSTNEKEKISSLQLFNLISAELYGFTYDAGELAFGMAITNVEEIKGEPSYSNSTVDPSNNRSGVLIRYTPTTTNSNEFLIIFNDRSVYYRDNNNNIFSDRQLSNSELNEILEKFTQTNFDNLTSNPLTQRYSPSLLFLCNRHQSVVLNDSNSYDLAPILDALDEIIDTYKSEATHRLSYNQKYEVKDWVYGDIITLNSGDNLFLAYHTAKLSVVSIPE